MIYWISDVGAGDHVFKCEGLAKLRGVSKRFEDFSESQAFNEIF